MFPQTWVGKSTSWTRLDSKINLQRLFDAVELAARVDQLMSGELKSPRSKTGVDWAYRQYISKRVIVDGVEAPRKVTR